MQIKEIGLKTKSPQHREDIMSETTEKYRAVIAVAAITPPRGQGKSYTLRTYDGNEFSLWPDKIGLIRADEQYDVEYTQRQANNGRTYYNIIGTPKHVGIYRPPSAEPMGPSDPRRPIGEAGRNNLEAWVQSATTPAMKNGKTKMENNNNYYKPRDPHEQKQIWVCALLAREIEKSPVLMNYNELCERARIHAEIWDEIFGPQELVSAHVTEPTEPNARE